MSLEPLFKEKNLTNFQGDTTNEGKRIMQFKLTWGEDREICHTRVNRANFVTLCNRRNENDKANAMIFSNIQFT